MNLRSIPRTALDRSVKLARLPLDSTLRVLGRNKGTGPAARADVAVDRIDAAVREVGGAVLGDEQLRDEAGRRRTAADERERGQELRSKAQQRKEQADDRLAQERADAEQHRQKAAKQAQADQQKVVQERKAQSRRLSNAAARRKTAVETAAAQVHEDVDERSQRQRLEQLEEQSEVLAEQREALAANDEARRLGKAAARTKAARKSG
jgi:hypothetical protein